MRKLLSLSLVVLISLLFAFNGCQCKKSWSTNPLGIKLEFEDGSEIFYRGDVSKSDAEELGEYLKEVNYIGDEDHPVSVQLLGEDGVIKVRFVLQEWAFNDEKTLKSWDNNAVALYQKLYEGEKVEVHLCDGEFNTKKVIHPEEVLSGGGEKKGKMGPT